MLDFLQSMNVFFLSDLHFLSLIKDDGCYASINSDFIPVLLISSLRPRPKTNQMRAIFKGWGADSCTYRSDGRWKGGVTVDGDDGQDEPGGPLRQVLDEDQSHEGADHDEVGLLQTQRSLPVDAHHAHHAEVPDDDHHGEVVHGHIVGLENFSVRSNRGMMGKLATGIRKELQKAASYWR